MNRILRIGARGSELSRTQTGWVADGIRRRNPEIEIEIVIVKTTGDRVQDRPLSEIGSQGLFTKELDFALLENQVDAAVHSLKDLPTTLTEGLMLAAIPLREDPRDVWISRDGRAMESLPKGSLIGTGSLRRRAQLHCGYPGLKAVDIRGNVDTRIRKLRESEEFSGIILAGAGVLRLGREAEITSFLALETWLPAPGQGALAVVVCCDKSWVLDAASKVDHPETHNEVAAERSFLAEIGAGCHIPVGAWARTEEDSLILDGMIAHPNGDCLIRYSMTGAKNDPWTLGRNLALKILSSGGREILADIS